MKFKICSLVLLLTFVFSLCTFAQIPVTVSVSYDSKQESISAVGFARGNILIVIAPFEASLESLGADADPVYMRQFYSSGDYNYTIKLPEGMASGKYSVYASNAEGSASDAFLYINLEKAAVVAEQLSASSSVSEYSSIAEDNYLELGIDLDDEKYQANKKRIYELLYTYARDITDPSEYNTVFYKMYALASIEAGSSSNADAVMQKFQFNLKIDYNSDFKNDTRLTPKAKDKLLSLLSSADYDEEFKAADSTDFGSVLDKYKCVAAVASASIWQNIKTAITEDFDELSYLTDNSTFKKVSDKNEVYAKMMEYEYKSFGDIEEVFIKCSKAVYNSENQSKGTASGSGGGFSGGSAVTTPPVMEESVPWHMKLVFTDIDDTHWSVDAVTELSGKKIINGYEDNTFRPDNNITRAEFTKIVVSVAEDIGILLEESSDALMFEDVSNSDWFYDCVDIAARSGLVNGADGLFNPNDYITRQDAAVIIYRLLTKKMPLAGNKVFSDRSDIASYARDAVASLASAKVVEGVGNNRFEPQSNITRAQSAQLLLNAIEFAS